MEMAEQRLKRMVCDLLDSENIDEIQVVNLILNFKKNNVKKIIKEFKKVELIGFDSSPEQIIEAICNSFEIEVEDLKGRSRRGEVVIIRHCIAYVLRKNYLFTLERIGEALGRNHATILNSVKVVDNALFTKDRVVIPIFNTMNEFITKLKEDEENYKIQSEKSKR